MSNWIDFYNNLVQSSQATSQFNQATRTNPAAVNLTYQPTRGELARAQKVRNPGEITNKKELLLPGGLGLAAGIIRDAQSGDNRSAGSRIIDLISRPLYGQVAATREVNRQVGLGNLAQVLPPFFSKLIPKGPDGNYTTGEEDGYDWGKILGAGWEGLQGKQKGTTSDLLTDVEGEKPTGFTGFARSFAGDVVGDPLSYVGPGAFRAAGNALKNGAKTTGVTAKTIADAEKAADGLVPAAIEGTIVSNNKSVDDLLRSIDRNQQVPGDNIFENIFAKQPNLAHPSRIPDEPRIFNVGSEGVANETKQLDGPSVDTLIARANMEDADRLAKGIPQFQYGSFVDDIPETGFYRQETKRVPIEETPFRPQNTFTEGKEVLREKYAFLNEAGDLPENPVARIIMSQVDEPVFPRYEPYEATHKLDSGKTVKWKAWRPNPEDVSDGLGLPMGEVRKQLIDPKTTPVRKQQLKSMLINHIRAVESYAKSGPVGFRDKSGYDNFYREMYGVSPKDVSKGKSTSIPGFNFPKSVFDDVPKYKEVQEWVKMDPVDKLLTLHKWGEQGLSEAHLTYLAQANNQKSFATRLAKLQTMLKEGGTSDARDLADAIEKGRIQALDEPGIPEMLKKYNVKTLNQLAKAIRKDERAVNAAELKQAGKPKDAVTVAKAPNEVKELGPTGLKYKPYEAKINRMVEEAKAKAATNKPAAKIIEDVLNGAKDDLAKPQVEFSFSHQTIFDNGLQRMVNENIISPKDTSLWKYVTRTGVKRTSKTVNKGRGRVNDAINMYSQYDFFKGMLEDVRNLDSEFKQWAGLRGIDPKDMGSARSQFVMNMTMKPMEAMDDLLKQGGIFPVAGTRVGDTPFSFFDAFSSLDPAFVRRYIFRLETHGKGPASSIIAPTQLIEAMNVGVTALRKEGNIAPDQLRQLLRDVLTEQKVTRNGKNVPNGFRNLSDDKINDAVADVINGLPELAQRVEKNEAARKLWHENQKAAATQDAFDEIARKLASPDVNLAKILSLSNEVTEDLLPKIFRLRGVDPEDAWAVKGNVNGGMNEFGMPPEVRAAGKRAKLKAQNPAKANEVDVQAAREADDLAVRSMEEDGIDLKDLGTKFERSLAFRMINEIFPHFGNARVRPIYQEHRSPMQTVSRHFQGMVGQISQKHTKADIQAAFNELQLGTWSKNPQILEAQKDINKAIGVIFADDATYSLTGRMGISHSTLLRHLDQYKVHGSFHPEAGNMHNVWREWKSDDPLNLLAQYFAASTRAASKKMLADHLTATFGSKVKHPGFIKIKSPGSPLVANIDTEAYYFPEEIAREMRVLDKFMRQESVSAYSDTAAGQMLRVYDNVLHRYKSGLTIYRPGHHVRNLVGDEWLSYMAGAFSIDSHTKALKVMAQMRGRFDDFDAVKALMYGEDLPSKTGKPDGIISTVRSGGKEHKLTATDIYRAAHSRGILPDYRTLEDIQIGYEGEKLGEGAKGLAKRLGQPFGGKVHDVAATVSSSRDHYVRMAHFINVIEKGGGRNIDEVFSKATQEVRKWHPDGSDLSHFEQRFMRRTVMFYSWIRKAIPLIIEGMVMRPGRANLYPKFMYNVAEANGIDLDGIGNPFPSDQMFPEWITDSLQGPVTQDENDQYWSISPGIPMMDVLSDYAGHDTDKSVIGSLTPLFTIPAELASGPEGAVAQDTRTGIPYYDKSDYADTLVPNSSYFTGITGQSLTQPWQSKGGDGKEVETETERNIINFLLGLGLKNQSKPSYIKQAKREQTTRVNEEREDRLKRIRER